MNTPAHLALSLFVWRDQKYSWAIFAIVLGALLPDLPMIGFYLYQKLILSVPEKIIWEDLYFLPSWQLFFDVFNAIPLWLIIAFTAYRLKRRFVFLVAASALLHLMLDLPLHHDDAHRHFLPFTQWRFLSPISYWNPKYFGQYAMALELLMVLATSFFVFRRGSLRVSRYLALAILIGYSGFLIFAFTHWG